jgi:hypothetical protein
MVYVTHLIHGITTVINGSHTDICFFSPVIYFFSFIFTPP